MPDQELKERPKTESFSKSNPTQDTQTEHGYKYEYTKDFPDDAGEETGMGTPKNDNDQMNPLSQVTAVMTKNQERIPYVHMLGKTYHPIHNYHERKKYERSLFWFSYRCDFPEIVPYGIDTDAGWGCMIRAAQMLIGHTLRIHYKSRHWKPPAGTDESRRDDFVKKLLTWFADFPSKEESVYSLQNFVAAGTAKYQVLPGEWWGPATACYAMRDLVDLHSQSQPSLFRVHVSSEGTVYSDLVHELMTKDSKKRAEERKREREASLPSPLHPLDPTAPTDDDVKPENLEWDTSLLLLIPVRLGLDKFNEEYTDSIARSFWLPQSVGILGGRPRSARWFYAAYADGSKVLGLDPHTIQSAPKRNCLKKVQLSDDYLGSVHTAYPDVYPILRLDTTLAIGFYCRTKKDFLSLEASLKELKKTQSSPDLFTFMKSAPNYKSQAMGDFMSAGGDFDEDCDGANDSDSDDDSYVLL